MASWHIQHRTMKDERRFVDDLTGVDPARWIITLLDRTPTDADDFIGGKLVRNEERATLLEQTRIRNVTPAPTRYELNELIKVLTERVVRLEDEIKVEPKDGK